jgi:hypothetical protein
MKVIFIKATKKVAVYCILTTVLCSGAILLIIRLKKESCNYRMALDLMETGSQVTSCVARVLLHTQTVIFTKESGSTASLIMKVKWCIKLGSSIQANGSMDRKKAAEYLSMRMEILMKANG